MKSNLKFFKKSKTLPVDKFLNNVLYDEENGYYSSKLPFGKKGDFITAPSISNLFCEMVAIWIISTWEFFGKPKKLNIVELGPGDGTLTKILLNVSKKFPVFDSSKRIFLFEESRLLKKIQKKNIKNKNVKWINNFEDIKDGPVIFFGNEFFDAIPIKQFRHENNIILEKYYSITKNYKIMEEFKKASSEDVEAIKSFKVLRNKRFIEYPKQGLKVLKKIIKSILRLTGCVLMIDYGYLKSNNQNTLQSVMKHKKNNILKNLGKADISSHVNFSLLNEFFLKNNLQVKDIISQVQFLKKMGILERAEMLSHNMHFNDKINLVLKLKRLLGTRLMGDLFKVILAYKFDNDNYYGF